MGSRDGVSASGGALASSRGGGRVGLGAGAGWLCAGRNDSAALLGDAELGRVLVLAGHVVDELDAIAVGAGGGLKIGRGSPGQATAVGNALSKRRAELDHVGRGALEEEDRDSVGGGWLPGDGEGLAGGDDLGVRLAAVFVCFTAHALQCAQHRHIPRSRDG